MFKHISKKLPCPEYKRYFSHDDKVDIEDFFRDDAALGGEMPSVKFDPFGAKPPVQEKVFTEEFVDNLGEINQSH